MEPRRHILTAALMLAAVVPLSTVFSTATAAESKV